MKKLILTAVALAVVTASPAFAATARHASGHAQTFGAWGAYAQSRDAGLGGNYVGTDPDRNVQLELLKDAQQRD